MPERERIVLKLEKQDYPTILLSDIDGTLFSPNLNLLTAPLFNFQTTLFLKKHHIPFGIVTGRSFWRRIDRYHIKLLGLPDPDVVITANGTAMYYLEKGNYVSDFIWQGYMQSTKVMSNDGLIESWNKWAVTTKIAAYLRENKYSFSLGKGNTYLIRIRVNNYPLTEIQKIQRAILQLFPKGIRIVLTEKLLWKNTKEIFSGELLITPKTAGKDKAVQYVLKKIAMELEQQKNVIPTKAGIQEKSWIAVQARDESKKSIHAFIFGDSSVDIPMLSMKDDDTYYTLSQYAVHPTPLAHAVLEQKIQTEHKPTILYGDGPKEILWTLRPELRPKISEFLPSTPPRFTQDDNKLSPAQNNKARRVIGLFEKVLDKIVDKEMSANEISFLGLKKLSEGLQTLQNPKSNFLDKTKGMINYGFGNLTDVLDGIRARRIQDSGFKIQEENGHIVDGFSDRVKEFMQLFARAKGRIHENETVALETFIAALSCALPSIAREQAEIIGKAVPEKDQNGGSMIDRTRRLFLSLLFTTFGLEDQSQAEDIKIYETNLATFRHRLTFSKKFTDISIDPKGMSDFQMKGLEKFLLYVDVLQQEDAIIKKYLSKYPTLLNKYTKESQKIAKSYLALSINKLRKKWGIKDYGLLLRDFMNK